MSIHKLLDLSTAHITQRDSEILDANPPIPLYPKTTEDEQYGWFIYVNPEPDDLKDKEQACRDAGLSEAFSNLLSYAQGAGCVWLMLDRDAEPIDGLPVFDW